MNDLIGKRFGMLVVLEYKDYIKKLSGTKWWCKCDCGTHTFANRHQLIKGKKVSCGCYFKKIIKEGTNLTHGFRRNRFYKIWCGIQQRCYNLNNPTFYRYGGKGIKCEWKSFEQFRDSMYKPYLEHCLKFGEKNTTLDRKDGNKNYCKENCRWATYLEQGNNTQRNLKIKFQGKSFSSLSALARFLKVNETLLKFRIKKNWPQKLWGVTPVFGRNQTYDKN